MPKKSNVKKRNWTFVLYPESAPDDWREQLQKTGLLVAISPLHNMDCNADGEVKKAHYHIILCYSGPTSYNCVLALTSGLNQPIPQSLESIRGMYRYFTHKDNPEKHQYDEKDITTLNGFCISDYVEMTKSEVNTIMKDIQRYIRENDVLEYSVLMDKILDSDLSDWFDVASSHTYFFEKYITSRRNMFKNLVPGETK